jgi:GNAT superfamily N-acetyltransferase
MKYLIRTAQKEDIDAIVEFNCSEVPEWFHYTKEEKNVEGNVSWESLTPYERFMHGGWWLDPKLLEFYMGIINNFGQIYILTNPDGKVIGEADVVVDQENGDDSRPYGYLIWFMIHPEYRRKGLGTYFLNQVINSTYETYPMVNRFETIPEDERSLKLYNKCGLLSKYKGYELKIPLDHDFEIDDDIIVNKWMSERFPQNMKRITRFFYPSNYSWGFGKCK